jgi:O-antigen ligase
MTAESPDPPAAAMTVGGALRMAPASHRRPFDAVVLLTIYLTALFVVPANLVVGSLGAAGTPALLIGLAAGAWWFGAQLDRSRANLTPAQPIRRAMLIFVMAVVASYVAGTTRPIEGIEVAAADRGLLIVFSWLGILLLTGDGVPTLARLEALLRRLVAAGGVVATLGVVQFLTGQALIDKLSIPGLSANNALTSVYNRNGFVRAAGTSTHPIEFGVLLAMVLPIALHFALATSGRSRVRRWFPVAAIAVAVPVTVSRSAFIAVVVVLAIMLPSWPRRRRRRAYVTIAVLLAAVYVGVPGLLGTIIRLFTGISGDNSARSRTDSYSLAWQFITRNPFFGRGISTFLPKYRILDNQYLGLTIETGFVGLGAFVLVLAAGVTLALKIRRTELDPGVRSLALALMATVAAAGVTYATFDAFGFTQVASLTFFVLGCIAALRRRVVLGGAVAGAELPPARRADGRVVAPPGTAAPAR